jgi:MFS family permease
MPLTNAHRIIFRAFQGMGGSGIYSMVTIMNPEMVPSSQWGTYVAITSVVFVLSSVLGPVLGGVINGHNHSSWRWVFLLKYGSSPCIQSLKLTVSI